MFSVSFSKIVGRAGKDQWSQVHTFIPLVKDKLRSFGTLMLVVRMESAVEGESKIDFPAVGKEFITRFHEQYYGSEKAPESPLSQLSETVVKVVGEFEYLEPALSESDYGSEELTRVEVPEGKMPLGGARLNIEVVAGVALAVQITGKLGVLYLCRSGGAEAYIMRERRLYRLFHEVQSDNGSKVQTVVSGFVKEGDMLALGSGDFFELIPSKALENALLFGDPAEASSILTPQLHERENSGVAAIFSLFKSEEVKARPFAFEEKREDKIKILEGAIGVEKFKRAGRRFKFVEKLQKIIGDSGLVLGKIFSREREIVVRDGNDRKRRMMLSIALVLLVLLGVSITLGWKRRVGEEQEKRFLGVWEVVEHQYQEAVSLKELNPLRSRALLGEAKELASEALGDSEKKFSKQQRLQLSTRLEEIEKSLEEVSGEHKIEEANVFLDLTLVRPNTYGEVMGLDEDTYVVLDRSAGVLLRGSVRSKSTETVGGGTLLSGAKLAAVYGGRGFVLANVGVVEVSFSGKTSSLVIEKDPEWGEIVDMESFAGNLYLLDRTRGEIFRYQGTEGGFGVRDRWLATGVFPDFSKAVSLAIDGDIWVLTDEEVLRFRSGVAQPFVVGGLDKQLANPVSVYTDEGSEGLYILDRGNRRVLVSDKNGEYRAQYLWEGIGGVSDMVVNEKEGVILLLAGPIIYEIEL